MRGQKMWNFLTVVAIAFLALGYFVGKANADIVGRIFIIVGAIVFVVSIVWKCQEMCSRETPKI